MKKGASLSGGRVQSVVNRLIIEREREIAKFAQSAYFKTVGEFKELNMDLDHKFLEATEVEEFIDVVAEATFKVESVKSKKTQRKPSTPFITSTLQQEASNKWRMSPKNTMSYAQKLYENGLITYMRTDSVTISEEILDAIKRKVVADYGDKYSKKTQYKNKSSNSQEAHEAIRPSDINKFEIKRDDNARLCDNCVKLYNLIWRRTIASQMSPAEVNIQTITVGLYETKDDGEPTDKSISDRKFIAKNEKILFDGFLKVYNPVNKSEGEDDSDEETSKKQVALNEGDLVNLKKVNSAQKYTKPPMGRFTEASLVKKLDEMGIGRPSTYSSMVSIVQDRKFAEKRDIKGEEREAKQFIFDANTCELEEKVDKTTVNGEREN
jgi:DNA topoisomerase-1